MDATCLCMRPLDEWIDTHSKSGFFAFSKPGPDRLVSSWFLASDQPCTLTNRYAELVNQYVATNNYHEPQIGYKQRISRKVKRLVRSDPWRSALLASPLYAKHVGHTPYFWFHYTFARLLLRSSSARKIWSAMPKVSADGPHSVQKQGMYKPVTEAVAKRIDSVQDPVYKLSWKVKPDDPSSESAVAYAMRKARVAMSA